MHVRQPILSTDFLKQLQAVQAEYRFRVSRSVLRGGYAGGGWRGALGRAFLPALCQEHPTAEPGDHPCLSQGCARPAECSYFSLFERDRDQSGENIPKPYVLGLPVDPAVRELLSGTNLPEPFRIRRDGILEKTQSTLYLPDQEISLCILWVGSIAVVEPAATQHLRSNGLDCGGGKLELEGVAWRNYLPASSLPVGTNRLRINFLTPFCTRSDDSNLEAIALRLPHVALVRAMKLFENFSGPVALRLPFQSFPEGALRLTRSQLYRYEFDRISSRQRRTVPMWGIIGWMEVEGDLEAAWPILKAAEWFHAGQKATFGFGQIEVEAV